MLHTLKYFTCLLISLVGILVSSCSFYDESEICYAVAMTSDGESVVLLIDTVIVYDDEPADELSQIYQKFTEDLIKLKSERDDLMNNIFCSEEYFKEVLEDYIRGPNESEVVRLTMQEDNTVKWEVYQRSDSNVIRKLMD